MTAADNLITTSLLAFAMKAHAQLRPGQQLEPLPYVHFVTSHLERVSSGKCKRLIVALPPRHAKTFLCSITLSAWILAHAPASKILLVSYGQELADKIAYDIREILRSGWFRRLFETRIAKGKLTDVVTTAGGGVRSVSVEGGVTGLGADFIIVDDPVQIKDSANTRQIERVNDLFDSEIRTRLNNPKKGAIVIVAHRLAEDDLPGHVKSEGAWTTVRLPLIAARSRTYKTAEGFEWLREKGELLRPDAFTPRDVERLRRMRHPDFETLQQQRPGARDRLRIWAEHFGAFASAEVPSDVPVVLSIDPGQNGGPTHSYSVAQVWALHDQRYLLLDQWRGQSRYRELRGEVYRLIRQWRPSVILIEATAQGPALVSDIRPQVGMEICAITPVEDKVTRLRRHQKTIRDGVVLLPQHAPWRDEFVNELTTFPYATFDDQVDAMTQFLEWIARNAVMKRPPRAVAAGMSGNGLALNAQGWRPALQCRGGVFVRRRT
jgi:predicted phage terminase large subunit-like protein